MANASTRARRTRRVHVEVPAEWLIDAAIAAALALLFAVLTWT